MKKIKCCEFGPRSLRHATNACSPMFVKIRISYSISKQKMMSFRGQASYAKMMTPGGKLTALACHLTKKVNKAE
jgi:hypothetical protein